VTEAERVADEVCHELDIQRDVVVLGMEGRCGGPANLGVRTRGEVSCYRVLSEALSKSSESRSRPEAVLSYSYS
jgi:hypothetical protein